MPTPPKVLDLASTTTVLEQLIVWDDLVNVDTVEIEERIQVVVAAAREVMAREPAATSAEGERARIVSLLRERANSHYKRGAGLKYDVLDDFADEIESKEL